MFVYSHIRFYTGCFTQSVNNFTQAAFTQTVSLNLHMMSVNLHRMIYTGNFTQSVNDFTQAVFALAASLILHRVSVILHRLFLHRVSTHNTEGE